MPSSDIGSSTIDISSDEDDEEDKAMKQVDMFDDQEPTKELMLTYKVKPSTKVQTCPCCDQVVKVYKRQINHEMCVCLRNLHMNSKEGQYIHIKDIRGLSGGGDFAKLTFWGLVEAEQNYDTGKRTSGMWCITQKGRDFVEGRIQVPKYALIYNSKFLEHEGELVSFKGRLGEGFNYQELMAS